MRPIHRALLDNLRYWAVTTLWLVPCVAVIAGLLGYYA